MKKISTLILSIFLLSACENMDSGSNCTIWSSEVSSSIDSEISETSSENKEETIDVSYREERNFNGYSAPTNKLDEDSLPKIANGNKVSDDFIMSSANFSLKFSLKDDKYVLSLIDNSSNKIMFINENPVNVYLKGSNSSLSSGYDMVELTDYGLKGSVDLISNSGSEISVTDCYYFPKENEQGVFNVRTSTTINKVGTNDTGFGNSYAFYGANNNKIEAFIPNNVFKSVTKNSYTYLETYLGIPFIMERDTKTGYTLSLSRYQPVITYEDYSYASLTLNADKQNISINYPAIDGNRMYHQIKQGACSTFDMSIRASITDNYEEASIDTYNSHFNLQNTRIVATDINEVYKVINEDYKTFLHAEEQEDEETGKKYTSYGLPWRITIEDGEFGPLTYQAGFIGQQIPSAYNMMLYGTINSDLTSLQNGINVIDFWVDDAEMMSIAGVPHIWYDTWADGFRGYPCFLRMAIDAMEGMLDAYRLALVQGLYKDNWESALDAFGEFLITAQNEDGSYYRCYNYTGGPYENWDDGIEEPVGDLCKSYNKNCTPMAVRFLGKMYELTDDDRYKEAAIKAGNYVYDNLYSLGYYQGGTCDGPNNIDKEGGVFAIYCYDTMYMLTKDDKWLDALKQAVAFTMSTVLTTSFPVKESNLKSAYPLYSGYSDGLSFITCGSGGVDNYIAYIYYELFRVYILTNEQTYLKQAEFIQQNTKSVMNWDGKLGYKYKSLVAEASSICNFKFSSASDGAWVTWSSVANVEPIAKMLTNFGKADVMEFSKTSIDDLRDQLNEIGIGGKEHTKYETSVYDKLS